MAHNEASLMKLNKENLVRITLDSGRFEERFSDLKSNLSGLKADFSKLEADIQASRNVNSELSEKLVTIKRGATLMNSILGGNV